MYKKYILLPIKLTASKLIAVNYKLLSIFVIVLTTAVGYWYLQ